MILHRASLGAACALCIYHAHAAHPLITEDTGTQGKGRWQLEINAEDSRDRSDGLPARALQAAATLTYGAIDEVDLQITLPYLRQKSGGTTAHGRLDTALDVKWRFYEDGALTFGLKPGVTLATGREDQGRGTGRSTWGSLLIFSYDRETWALHSHAGYRRNRNSVGQRESLGHLSAAVWLKPTPKLKVVLDASLDSNPGPSTNDLVRQAVVGIIYSATPDFDLDAGIRRANAAGIDRAFLVGATLRW